MTSILSLLLLGLLPPFATPIPYIPITASVPYIRYNGSIAATYIPPISLTNCSATSTNPYRGSDLFVGAFPVLDTNPFFFQLEHIASNHCEQEECPFDYSDWSSNDNIGNGTSGSRTQEKRQFTVLTYDKLRNVAFSSAAYVCLKEDGECSTSQGDSGYGITEALDLTKAQVEKVDDIQGQKGYSVRGDEKTWAKNNTSESGFDFDTSCFGSVHFSWCVLLRTNPGFSPLADKVVSRGSDSTQSLTYTLAFSNTSATFTSSLVSNSLGTVNITFNGTRIDDYSSYSVMYNYGEPMNTTIELLTDNSSTPTWGWSNGTRVERQGADSTTLATGTPTPSPPSSGVGRESPLTLLVYVLITSGATFLVLMCQYVFP